MLRSLTLSVFMCAGTYRCQADRHQQVADRVRARAMAASTDACSGLRPHFLAVCAPKVTAPGSGFGQIMYDRSVVRLGCSGPR